MPLTQNELQEYDIHHLFAKYRIGIFHPDSLPIAITNHLGGGIDAIFKAWVRDGFLRELQEPGYYEYTQVAKNRYQNLKSTYKHQKLEQWAFWFLVFCGFVGALGAIPSIRKTLFSTPGQASQSITAPILSPPPQTQTPQKPDTMGHRQDSVGKKSK